MYGIANYRLSVFIIDPNTLWPMEYISNKNPNMSRVVIALEKYLMMLYKPSLNTIKSSRWGMAYLYFYRVTTRGYANSKQYYLLCVC